MTIRKLIASVLMISLVASVFHFDEFVKVPGLFNHYRAYQSGSSGDGVFEFLAAHYLNCSGTPTTEESADHQDLPFKSEKGFQSHVSLFLLSSATDWILSRDLNLVFIPLSDHHHSIDISEIFQPPRPAELV